MRTIGSRGRSPHRGYWAALLVFCTTLAFTLPGCAQNTNAPGANTNVAWWYRRNTNTAGGGTNVAWWYRHNTNAPGVNTKARLYVYGTTNGTDGFYISSAGYTDTDFYSTHYEPIFTNTANGGWVTYMKNAAGFKSWAIQKGPVGNGLIYVNGTFASNNVPPMLNWTNSQNAACPVIVTYISP